MWMLLSGMALAGPPMPPPPNPEIEVVRDEPAQGKFRLVYAGREGDALKVDGWPFGNLPVETELAEGLHTFRIDGEAGKVEVSTTLVVQADAVVEIDLAAVSAPAPTVEAQVMGDKPELNEERAKDEASKE